MKSKFALKRIHCPDDDALHGCYVKLVAKGPRPGLVMVEFVDGPTQGTQLLMDESYLQPGLRLVG